MLFDTPRLIVRQLDADDEAAMLAVYGDADAMRWVGAGMHAMPPRLNDDGSTSLVFGSRRRM